MNKRNDITRAMKERKMLRLSYPIHGQTYPYTRGVTKESLGDTKVQPYKGYSRPRTVMPICTGKTSKHNEALRFYDASERDYRLVLIKEITAIEVLDNSYYDESEMDSRLNQSGDESLSVEEHFLFFPYNAQVGEGATTGLLSKLFGTRAKTSVFNVARKTMRRLLG